MRPLLPSSFDGNSVGEGEVAGGDDDGDGDWSGAGENDLACGSAVVDASCSVSTRFNCDCLTNIP